MKLIVLLNLITLAFSFQVESQKLSTLQKFNSSDGNLNLWPIIGLFAQPSTDSHPDCGGSCQYIAASYVKYIESSGARVVPINYYASNTELSDTFSKLNGFFFPGGGSAFPKSAQTIFDLTKQANDAGDHMPLWGTCMGFQWLLIAASGDPNILDPDNGKQLDAYNYSIPLEVTPAALSSRLLGTAPAPVLDILTTQNVTMNNHHYGIYTQHFKSTSSLTSFFNLLSVNSDRQGVEFVSTIEAFDYPIYGTQWHPEKNNFEWAKESDGTPKEAINHSPQAILASQYPADFFVQEARKSKHKYPTFGEEDSSLIYNYRATKTTGDFVQKYYFHF